MKLSATIKSIILDSICLLYVLLFVYAAVSKLLDFENFRVQLGQSPLISSFAGWLSLTVPLSELLIALLLLIHKTRMYGLYLSYFLMVLFTTYIFIILNYSASIPCSCGGVLEQMGWQEHLWFNVFFIALAVVGIILMQRKAKLLKTIFVLFVGAFVGVISLVVLYKVSHTITKHHNTFIRNFPMASRKISEMDLNYNSYYFAGAAADKVYLGNSTAPLEVLVLEKEGSRKERFRISFDSIDLPFRAVQVRIQPPYFYAYDGTVSCLYTGLIANWKCNLQFRGDLFFDQVIALDSTRFVFREQKANGSVLGMLDLKNKDVITYNRDILQKQIDGIFDVDGKLLLDANQQELVYIYSYRNQFTGADKDLKIRYRGTTIDTITQAQIKIASVKNRGQKKLAVPALVVNNSAAVYGSLLFVHSGISGRYEPEEMWKVASIVDVYSLEDRSYISSIYVHNMDRKKMSSFIVEGNRLYAMAGTKLAIYELDSLITSKYKQVKKNLSADSRGRSKT